MASLAACGVPFVAATVVRAQCPTSAHPGDSAVVLSDGSIEGFVGGQCAESSVRAAALEVLDSREALLLRILPEGEGEFPESPGARTVVNPCLSGGALEVFLEPRVPAPAVSVVGATPIADAIAALAEPLGFAVVRDDDGPARPEGAVAVVISSHGRREEESLRAALDAGVGFIGLVASRKRGAEVLASLRLTDEERARIRTPVGLKIGARTAEEIALSILADVVRSIRIDGLVAPASDRVAEPLTAIDPVCGMAVLIDATTPHQVVDDTDYWFCSAGCCDAFAAAAATG